MKRDVSNHQREGVGLLQPSRHVSSDSCQNPRYSEWSSLAQRLLCGARSNKVTKMMADKQQQQQQRGRQQGDNITSNIIVHSLPKLVTTAYNNSVIGIEYTDMNSHVWCKAVQYTTTTLSHEHHVKSLHQFTATSACPSCTSLTTALTIYNYVHNTHHNSNYSVIKTCVVSQSISH
jgi:hypothetical protein